MRRNSDKRRDGRIDIFISHADDDHVNAALTAYIAEVTRFKVHPEDFDRGTYHMSATQFQELAEWSVGQKRRDIWSSFYSYFHLTPTLRYLRAHRPGAVKITIPPGHTLLRLAGVFLRKKEYERCEEQVADMREEVFEALRDGKPLRARVLPFVYLVIGIWSVLSAIPAAFAERVIRQLR